MRWWALLVLVGVAGGGGVSCQEGGDCAVGEDVLGGWKPWDDGDLDVMQGGEYQFASDSDPVRDCIKRIRVVGGGARVALVDALKLVRPQMHRWKQDDKVEAKSDEKLVYVAGNGENEGVQLAISGSDKARCFGTLAELAVAHLFLAPTSSQFEPKRLYSFTGRPIQSWLDVEKSDFILHVLIDRQEWIWAGGEVGFSFQVAGVRLVTVAMQPKVLLAQDIISEEDAREIMDSGSKDLYASPEQHYSDDPKYQNYRTSETASLSDAVPAVKRLRHLAWQVLRLHKYEMVEPLQLLRYNGPGKWYKEHQDVFHNVDPLGSAEEHILLDDLPEAFCTWAEESRQLLWQAWRKVWQSPNEEHSPWMLRAAELHLRPHSAWYPDPSRSGFRDLAVEISKGESLAQLDDDDFILDKLDSAWTRKVLYDADKLDDEAYFETIYDSIRRFGASQRAPKTSRIQRNRFVTMLPYLNKVDGGGETVFPYGRGKSYFGSSESLGVERQGMPECSRGLVVPPVARGAAIFYHVHPDGTVDPLSVHGGCPPMEGSEKWAINVFCWNLDWRDGLKYIRQFL